MAVPAGTDPSTYTVTINQHDIPAAYTAVVGVAQSASGEIELAQGAFRSALVPRCFNVTPLVRIPTER